MCQHFPEVVFYNRFVEIQRSVVIPLTLFINKVLFGKCLIGLFFCFKLYLICNEKDEFLNFIVTPGDMYDRKPLEYKNFLEFMFGKLVGGKGYINKVLFNRLVVDGIQIITKLESNKRGVFNTL